MMKKALLGTYSEFPNGSATATRIKEFIYILNYLGFSVTVLTMNMSVDDLNNKELQNEYISLRTYPHGNKKSFLNYILYLRKMKKIIKKYQFELFLDMGLPIHCFFYIRSYCKCNKLNFISDILDWYSPIQFKLNYFSPSYLINNLYIRFGINKTVKVIAISRYLENYFTKKGVSVVYIPFVFRQETDKFCKKEVDNIVEFIYAGIPGNKDLLYPFLNAMALLNSEELQRVFLRLYGVDNTYLYLYKMKYPFEYEYIKNNIKAYGIVGRNVIMEAYSIADFSILLRDPDARFSKAGFPTKVSESLNLHTPIFGNLTSDLETFLVDEWNSIIVIHATTVCCVEKIKTVLKLTVQDRQIMYDNAFLTAKKYLDTLNYIEKFRNMILL